MGTVHVTGELLGQCDKNAEVASHLGGVPVAILLVLHATDNGITVSYICTVVWFTFA